MGRAQPGPDTPRDGGLAPAEAPAALPLAVPADRQSDTVAVITIRGGIDRWTAVSVERRLRQAEAAQVDAVVVELDTPGGELGAVLEITTLLKSTSVPMTVAWVHPEAHSGGAIIALACRRIVTSDPSSFGDAGVISALTGIVNLPDYERKKALAPLMADLVDSARRNGHDELFVQGFASLGVELWYVQQDETGRRIFIDRNEYRTLFGEDPETTRAYLAGDPSVPTQAPDAEAGEGATPRPDLAQDPSAFIPATPALAELTEDEALAGAGLADLEIRSDRPVLDASQRGKWTLVKPQRITDGTTFFVLTGTQLTDLDVADAVVDDEQDLQVYLGSKSLTRLDRSWSESAVRTLTFFPVRGLLIAVFLIALFLEMSSPGVALPGAIALGALALLIAPPMLVGLAGWWEAAAIIAGLLLILIEVFVVPGVGIVGVIGLVSLFAGLVGTFIPDSSGLFPGSPGAESSAMMGVMTILLSTATAVIAMYFLSKQLSSFPLFGRLVLSAPASDTEPAPGLLAAMEPEQEERPEIGAVGTTVSTLRPVGRAQFGDRLHDAVSTLEYIETGVRVRVVGYADFGRVEVEPDSTA